MAGRSDTHRGLVGGLANGLFVHLDEVGVALADLVLAQALDGVAEVQVHRVVQRANTQASVNLLGDGTGSNVTRNQVAECRVAALQEVVALFFRNGIRVAVVALLLRGPNAAVVTQGLRHQDGLGLPIGVDRQARRVELHEGRGGQVSTAVIRTHHGAGIGVLSQGGHVVDVAVAAGTQHNCMAGEGLELTGN